MKLKRDNKMIQKQYSVRCIIEQCVGVCSRQSIIEQQSGKNRNKERRVKKEERAI